MISAREARKIAAETIGEGRETSGGFTPTIPDGETLERDFGWVFFYESQEYLDTGEFGRTLAGNSPIIVDRRDGSVHKTGTARSIDYYLEEYVKRRSRASQT
jgi:hypothetical protein